MRPYRVVWEIELDADTPEAAAQEAYAIWHDPAAIPPIFDVTDCRTALVTHVDLSVEDGRGQ